MSTTVFLVGAGASFDAGMPLVTQLTKELRDRLADVTDINGDTRAEFPKLFDVIAGHDGEVKVNYERFFEWLSFIQRAQMAPLNIITSIWLDQALLESAGELAFVVKNPVWEILRSRHQSSTYQPGYFATLRDFLPEHGRLKVFTTNYDLCVEDACRNQGVDVVTGFHPSTERWTPSLFLKTGPGINLYKLHGSLNWNLSYDQPGHEYPELVERYPPKWEQEPDIVLGPGSKLQFEDPFAALYAEFHNAIRQAKICVAIGYSFRDPHIKEPIRAASHRGMAVIDVNPSPNEWLLHGYTKIHKGAKEAFESGEIGTAVRRGL